MVFKFKAPAPFAGTFSNDNGDEIQLHIHNSLYVPFIPLNLLSPQQICQQTQQPDNGFIIGASHGTLRFANHQRTIY
jgi:hypothetical protein